MIKLKIKNGGLKKEDARAGRRPQRRRRVDRRDEKKKRGDKKEALIKY